MSSKSIASIALVLQSFIILAISYLSFALERPYTAEFVSYSHEYSRNAYNFLNISLLNESSHMVLNGSLMFKADIDNFDLVAKAWVKQDWKSPFKMVDVKLNGCDLLDGNSKTMVLTLRNMVKSFGLLLPEKCPLKMSKEYYLKNFYLDVNMLPPRMPDMNVLATPTLKEKRQTIYTGNFSVVIKNRMNG